MKVFYVHSNAKLYSKNHPEELDYLLNSDRDETFYVTLALFGISTEHLL